MDGYPQPEGVLETLGVPPDMAGKIRRRGVMPAPPGGCSFRHPRTEDLPVGLEEVRRCPEANEGGS
jgi:hypothetical protein